MTSILNSVEYSLNGRRVPWSSNGFDAKEDIDGAVSGQMVLLERFDKLFESRSRGDILVGIDVPLLGCASGNKAAMQT
jgi:hypothetical protein